MRIWFNRGFSLAPISAAMRAAVPGLDVFVGIGSGKPQYDGPTESWIEPDCEIADYLDWVRETVTTHAIDILIPTRHREAIAQADLPCRVELPAALPVLQLLDDKYAFSEAVNAEPYHLATRVIESSDALFGALAEFATAHADDALPCVKPRQGVNGLGFWMLTRTGPTAHIDDPDRRRIRADLYIEALRAREAEAPIRDLVLMEYLPGPEISFDMLAHRGTLLKYVARTKLPSGRQHIQSVHPLAPEIAGLVERFALHGVVNAQFRRATDGAWKLLEINARPAGGVVYAEQVGANLLADWARLLTGTATAGDIRSVGIDTEVSFSTCAHPTS